MFVSILIFGVQVDPQPDQQEEKFLVREAGGERRV